MTTIIDDTPAARRQRVRNALKQGARPTSLGQDEETGDYVLRVSALDPREAWCSIPAADIAPVHAWFVHTMQRDERRGSDEGGGALDSAHPLDASTPITMTGVKP